MSKKPGALQSDLLQSRVHGVAFHISDLARWPAVVVEDRLFEDCDIYGPGMIYLERGGELTGNHFDLPNGPDGLQADVSHLFVPIAKVPEQLIFGAMVCRNCVFRRSRFHGVQLLVLEEHLQGFTERMRASLGSKP